MHCVAEPFKAHPFAVAREKTIAQLGDEIAVLSAHIQAATYRLLVLIREFEDLNGWEEGFSSCARWLSWRVGLAPGAAREKVRVARALAELPVMSEAMRQGELSYSKVRALTRVATPQNEERLLGFAQAGTAHHVERVVRAWRGIDARKELQRDTARHGKRYFRIYTDDDGMVVIRGPTDAGSGRRGHAGSRSRPRQSSTWNKNKTFPRERPKWSRTEPMPSPWSQRPPSSRCSTRKPVAIDTRSLSTWTSSR